MMYLLSEISDFRVGDFIVQLIFFLILVGFVVGVSSLIVMFKRTRNRLDRVEEKLDELLDKEK